MDEDTNDDP